MLQRYGFFENNNYNGLCIYLYLVIFILSFQHDISPRILFLIYSLIVS